MSEEELKLKNGEQPIAKISDTELVILILRNFANNSTLVTKKLNKIKSDSKSGKNRISASVLKIANRDLNKIDLLIEKANEDFRDIICEAEYPQLNTLASVANLTQGALWQSMLTHFVYVGIGILPSHLRPDQIYGLSTKLNASNNQSTIRIHQTVFHESGHYSHALKAGSWLWANVFASELKNDLFNGGPYANGVLPTNNAGARIGLAEGWAAFTEFKITDYFYTRSYVSATNIGVGFRTTAELNTILENFNVVDRPISINRFDDRSWWLHGIYWDLLDNVRDTGAFRLNGNGNPLNPIADAVNLSIANNQYNLSPIFNRLTSGVHNVSDFKFAILSSYSAQSAEINQLFTSYGY